MNNEVRYINPLIKTDCKDFEEWLSKHNNQIRNEVIDELIRLVLISRPDTVADYKCSDGVVRSRPLYDCATICEKLEQMKGET